MRYKTDLDAVKRVSTSLLYTQIHETKFSPMVVQHPFTSSAFVSIKNNGDMELLNILESPENRKKWHNFMVNQINKAEDIYQIFIMVNKPYALTFLKFTSKHLSFEDFSKILGDAWVMSENPNCDANVSKSELVKFFNDADPEVIMTSEERKQLDELEDTVTVYRGVTTYNEKNIRALSWSLDYDKANWFAHRFGEDGKVYQASINKQDILALFNGRSEAEVVVNPSCLKQISEVEETAQCFRQSI